jgi:chemotaxis protein CheD
MELLVNDLLRHGARRDRLEAKLFGGARMVDGLTDVGAQNAAFAERFLKDEGIHYVGGSLRGEHARRVQFWPASGRGRQLLLGGDADVFNSERTPPPAPAAPQDSGALELF